jgi:hypothetical protein
VITERDGSVKTAVLHFEEASQMQSASQVALCFSIAKIARRKAAS